MIRKFIIHGDNVVECERARELLERALELKLTIDSSSPHQAPIFLGYSEYLTEKVSIQMLSGHNRWGFQISAALSEMGSTIRENADAVITESIDEKHKILFALEYCGALPAGNNAWQRHGRAYSFGQAGVPYFIYNEIGGQELKPDRSYKAPRFPNPAVPLSLVKFSREMGVAVLPIYEAAPSATENQVREFKEALGDQDVLNYIRSLITGQDTYVSLKNLETKALKLGLLLAKSKKRQDGYSEQIWKNLIESGSGLNFYLENPLSWGVKSSDKVETSSRAREVLDWLNKSDLLSLGSTSLRFALLDTHKRSKFATLIKNKYPEVSSNLHAWLKNNSKPLVVVLVTGFKPKGDDSRPDRGLVPLARMLAGQASELLTFVSGPAKASMYQGVRKSPENAASNNGLLQSIFACSDWALLDTKNEKIATGVDTRTFQSKSKKYNFNLPGIFTLSELGEHDIDAIFHFACTTPPRSTAFEGMCNPPGGDWSGINLRLLDGRIARWTSLPRVSGTKRPDHVVQLTIDGQGILLSIESKQKFSDLEFNIGQKLKSFVQELLSTKTTVVKNLGAKTWSTAQDGVKMSKLPVYSMAIATDGPNVDLNQIIKEYSLDFAIAFSLEKQTTAKVRIAATKSCVNMGRNIAEEIFNKSNLDFKICE